MVVSVSQRNFSHAGRARRLHGGGRYSAYSNIIIPPRFGARNPTVLSSSGREAPVAAAPGIGRNLFLDRREQWKKLHRLKNSAVLFLLVVEKDRSQS